MRNLGRVAGALARARWGYRFDSRDALLAWQQQRIARFMTRVLPNAPFYRPYAKATLSALPIVDKPTMLENFAAFNVRGIGLDRAIEVAVAAEQSRDFLPTIDGLTVGLSSGTSGRRGVFLVSADERERWAGVMLGRVLTRESFRRLLDPFAPALRVAFFLRANSNLYESLSSRRLRFAFHDLLDPLEEHVRRLNDQRPDVLVAPPTVLRRLAECALAGDLSIAPHQIVSVAEVLEPDDRVVIDDAFGVSLQEIYQATEGLLGASCSAGRVHLNEELIHVEPEWLDAQRRRFRPVVTDFSRTTQLIVRYRLDDVLIDAGGMCGCGRVTRSLEAVEGRMDDVLWLPSVATWRETPVFPDLIRRSMALAAPGIREYRIEQRGDAWRVHLDVHEGDAEDATTRVGRELEALCGRLGLQRPPIQFEPWSEPSMIEKRRRIRCVERMSRVTATI